MKIALALLNTVIASGVAFSVIFSFLMGGGFESLEWRSSLSALNFFGKVFGILGAVSVGVIAGWIAAVKERPHWIWVILALLPLLFAYPIVAEILEG